MGEFVFTELLKKLVFNFLLVNRVLQAEMARLVNVEREEIRCC